MSRAGHALVRVRRAKRGRSCRGSVGAVTTAAGPVRAAAIDAIRRTKWKALEIRRLFTVPDPCQRPGKLLLLCWTSRGRFAKRRPLAKAFRTRFRAHSSVGRADDS